MHTCLLFEIRHVYYEFESIMQFDGRMREGICTHPHLQVFFFLSVFFVYNDANIAGDLYPGQSKHSRAVDTILATTSTLRQMLISETVP